ncbi:MAG: cyclic pyranopterin monophosphate synthase MoaC [Synergistaceae bacterium]|jgi:cyclic pyranopterin phosphate synthase|nr:cyclic pyranopterin monophosphate synthase MoaC [Synergistaceae bacterium]
MNKFSHFDESGRPRMVDVGEKSVTRRRAVAECILSLTDKVYEALLEGGISKGDPFKTAELGGIMAAKKTPGIIPLCHNIRLDAVSVKCEFFKEERAVRIECEVSATDVTGVEMEALVGATVAALVFYDMCKALDKGMKIKEARLIEKSGGRSGHWKKD